MKSLFIYEELYPPYDEGMKKFSSRIYGEIAAKMPVTAIKDIQWLPLPVNSLLIVPRILLASLLLRPAVVVFIPKQSLTFFSLIKAASLHFFLGDRLRTVGLQKRDISGKRATIIKKLKIGKVFSLSIAMKDALARLNIQAEVIYTGIDAATFTPTDNKTELRKKYGLPENKTIILHVGHIKASRNLELLIQLQNKLSNCQIVMVGSTATQREIAIQQQCKDAGIVIIDRTIDAINELYALSDIYCFPVKTDNGAMETPLSVLEAMSCNLPVITTRFGQLTELFEEDRCYRYIEDSHEVDDKLINELITHDCHNRDKVSAFTWQATAEKILAQ